MREGFLAMLLYNVGGSTRLSLSSNTDHDGHPALCSACCGVKVVSEQDKIPSK